MRTRPYLRLISIFFIILIFYGCKQANQDQKESTLKSFDYLTENFKSPPAEYGVNCWWWWLNGNVTKESITKDLEAMKSRNFHGAMIFDAGGHNQRGNRDIPDGPLFGSDEWNELFVFALDEAKRLGLEIGFNIQSGWNLGGPRVTPEYAAKQITVSRVDISGGKPINQKLDQPDTRKDYYRDIAVLAVPVPDGKPKEMGISDLTLKLGFRELGGSAPDCRFLLTNNPRNPDHPDIQPAYRVYLDQVIDLTEKMSADGNIVWDAPEGSWAILRFGYTCTNAHVSTSSNQWQGNVLDYMSREAFDFYWDDVVSPIFEAAADHIGSTLKYMETDSWECGGMNWTNKFREEFLDYRGYDLTSYLPVVAGFVVENIETSNAFLADFRKTLGDLVADRHYAVFAEYAHKHNMGIQPESAGPHAGPMDGIKNYGFSDIVMSEFWSPSPHRPRPENRFFLKQASSAAHIYGKKIIGAESFTTIGPHWNDELWHDQKSAFDHEICAGLNRLYFHTFTASPKEMGLPGQEYFAGTHVNPQVTWWDESGPFIDYMHRTQLMVQNGKFVADVLYYYGDHVPNVFSIKASDPAGAIPGFDYDVTDETILLQLDVEDGKIIIPCGMEYRVLVLPDHRVLSLAALEKVEQLLKAGASVIGHKPQKMVSLSGGQKNQDKFHNLADKIWDSENHENGARSYGKGNIIWGLSARKFLIASNIYPDFKVLIGAHSEFDYIHYKADGKDVYFVSNQTEKRKKIKAQFRVAGHQPEIWDALSGEIRTAEAFEQKDGLTSLPLTFDPYGSVFVVFNEPISQDKQGSKKRNYHDYESIEKINGEWKVEFDTAFGAPGQIVFPDLMDWTEHQDKNINYYSGKAVYKKSFMLDFEIDKKEKYYLQLGAVKDVGIAEVSINGINKGVLWTSPFRVDISDVIQEGTNTLEIKVVNSWHNRVAGDEMLNQDKKYTSTNIILGHDFRGRPIDEIPLEPSGLLGPVEVLRRKTQDAR